MSFLLDVADPSIHFHARPCKNSTLTSVSSPSTSTTSTSTTNPASKPKLFSTLSSPTMTCEQPLKMTSTGSAPVPVPMAASSSMFSTMSRMIRTASSGAHLLPGLTQSTASSQQSSCDSSPASSPPSTPESMLQDPFHTAAGASTKSTTSSSSTSRPLRGSSLSPWMMPSVCDDDQMNKLVSFQL